MSAAAAAASQFHLPPSTRRAEIPNPNYSSRKHHLPSSPNHSKLLPCSVHQPLASPRRYAVLGAGFAGLSVAWHLLELSPKGSHVSIDIIDEIGIGGGASGMAGGLIHPYSPKVKVLWKGAECWRDCLKMLDAAERVAKMEACDSGSSMAEQFVWRSYANGIQRHLETCNDVEKCRDSEGECSEFP